LKSIVVATDFSDHAAAAFTWGIDLARAHGADMTLVHAIETELPALAETGLLTHHVRNRLQRICDLHRIRARTEFGVGKPWEVISQVAKDAKADLIVVGAHGASKFSERFPRHRGGSLDQDNFNSGARAPPSGACRFHAHSKSAGANRFLRRIHGGHQRGSADAHRVGRASTDGSLSYGGVDDRVPGRQPRRSQT
jgi:nucleotide-binding universal stress UspA family protein